VIRKGLKPGEHRRQWPDARAAGDTVAPKPVSMAFRSELEPRGNAPDRKQAAEEKAEKPNVS
jgi:multidrug efflux system membrane fusion protein